MPIIPKVKGGSRSVGGLGNKENLLDKWRKEYMRQKRIKEIQPQDIEFQRIVGDRAEFLNSITPSLDEFIAKNYKPNAQEIVEQVPNISRNLFIDDAIPQFSHELTHETPISLRRKALIDNLRRRKVMNDWYRETPNGYEFDEVHVSNYDPDIMDPMGGSTKLW